MAGLNRILIDHITDTMDDDEMRTTIEWLSDKLYMRGPQWSPELIAREAIAATENLQRNLLVINRLKKDNASA